MRRLQHVAATSTTLELPRGRHTLRISADPNYLHHFAVYSADKFTLAAPSAVLAAADGVHMLEASEKLPSVAAGGWRVAARHAFRVPQACHVSISLRAAPAATQRHARVLVIDNGTRAATELILGEIEALPMVPNTDGYTVLALVRAPADAPLPEGSYRLRVTSDAPLAGFAALPCARCDAFQGVYEANQRAAVWTYVISTTQACQIAAKLSTELSGVAGTLTLEAAVAEAGKGAAKGKKPAGAEDAGGGDTHAGPRPPLLELQVAGDAEVPCISVPAGRSTLTFRLSRDRCAFNVLPSGVLHAAGTADGSTTSGSNGARDDEVVIVSPQTLKLSWHLHLAATVEEKACSFARDASGDAQRAAQLKEWVDRGAGGGKLRPKNGETAAAAHAAAMRAAEATGGEVRVTRTVAGQQIDLSTGRTTVGASGGADGGDGRANRGAAVDADVLLAARTAELQRAEAANAEAAAGFVEASKADARALMEAIKHTDAAQAGARDAAASAAEALQAQRAAVVERCKHAAAAATVRAA